MDLLSMGSIHGMQVIVSDTCETWESKQYRFPKSKKKRIRKKWSKRSKNFRVTKVHNTIVIGNKVYMSRKIWNKINGLTQNN